MPFWMDNSSLGRPCETPYPTVQRQKHILMEHTAPYRSETATQTNGTHRTLPFRDSSISPISDGLRRKLLAIALIARDTALIASSIRKSSSGERFHGYVSWFIIDNSGEVSLIFCRTDLEAPLGHGGVVAEH